MNERDGAILDANFVPLWEVTAENADVGEGDKCGADERKPDAWREGEV